MSDVDQTQIADADGGSDADSVSERTSLKALAGGGSILALAMLAANGGNYLLNLLLGRWLTPSEFADANLMVTLMLLVTAIAVSLQLISARFAGIHAAAGTGERADVLARWLERRALVVGVVLAAFLAGGASFWSSFFNTESAVPFVILGLGMPFYLIQAVGRGLLQGRLTFAPLAISFVIEMLVRVGAGLSLVLLGYGVEGATAGLSLSFLATWAAVKYLAARGGATKVTEAPSGFELGKLRAYIGPVAILLLGQIIINNGDVLVVKRVFDGDSAGVYAAIALIGRAVFFLSWSAVTTLFPAVAQREEAGEGLSGLLLGGVVTVAGMCGAMTLAAWIGGDLLLTGVFGPAYAGVGDLLAQYALATSMFAVANVMVSHHLSSGRSRESWILLVGGFFQTALLLARNATMAEVVGDQIVAMGVLLAAVTISSWDELSAGFLTYRRPAQVLPGAGAELADDSAFEASGDQGSPEATEALSNRALRPTGEASQRTEKAQGTGMDSYRQWATTPIEGTPDLSVVIPTYNEEWRILPTIGAVSSFVSSMGLTWELIVSDDGSSDKTLELVGGLDLVNLRALRAPQNTGKGGAVRRGVKASRGRMILFADADQATPIEQLPAMIEAVEGGADIAIGSRAADGASVENKSLPRKLLSAGLQGFVRLGFRLPFQDTQCGFKLFDGDLGRRIFAVQQIDGFSFDLEVLYIAVQAGHEVAEVPVEWHDAPGSTVEGGRVAIKFLKDMPRILSNGFRGRYALPARSPVAEAPQRGEDDRATDEQATTDVPSAPTKTGPSTDGGRLDNRIGANR